MRPTADRASAPISLVNIMFWQVSGLVIGGLTPTSVLAFFSMDFIAQRFLVVAMFLAPATAILGGVVGTIIGICDRRPFGGRAGAGRGTMAGPGEERSTRAGTDVG
jgi:hypothetical protein